MSDTELVEKAIVRADKVPRSSEPVKNTRRKITDMSVEEKNAIIAAILNGKEHEHYDLKAFQKGTCRLIKKPSKTIFQEAAGSVPASSNKQNLTHDQWIMQNLIDIKSENTVLKTKLKKYKKKLNDLCVVVEDDDVSIPVQEHRETPIENVEQIENIEPQQVQYVSRHLSRRR